MAPSGPEVRKYREHMDEAVYQGFWLHLYVDKRFFRDYIPKVAAFYDSDGRITDKREETERVFLKKQCESVTVDQYLSEQYYYGDYTRMNNWLWERFHLPEDLELPEETVRAYREEVLAGLASYQEGLPPWEDSREAVALRSEEVLAEMDAWLAGAAAETGELYAALLAQANDPEEEMTAAGAAPEAAAAVEQRFAQLREESGS